MTLEPQRLFHRFRRNARSFFTLPVFLISGLFLYTCRENPAEYSLGRQFVESQTSLSSIDTFSVRLSTVLFDSVQTSGTSTVLLGNYRDAVFGSISSNSYMQMAIPSSHDVQQNDQYKSLYLVLRFNGYYFGDSTKPLKISAHQLTENIEYDYDNVINSTTSFRYQSDPLGSVVCTPRPNSADTVSIRIRDDIGVDLFTKLRDNADEITTNDLFTEYFHGLVLVTDDAYQGSIIGFSGNQQDVRLVLFTTRSDPTPEEIRTEFTMNDSSKQFNKIVYDRSATQLKGLSQQRNKLSSSSTAGLSFLQGGVGLAIRVDFPSLQQALLFQRSAIVSGQLSIAPLRNSYNDIGLPSALTLYESDALNRSQSGISVSTLAIDELYHEETTYTFDVTQYLKNEFADSYLDPANGLLVTLPVGALNSSFARFIADAGNSKTRLKIYYLSY